jgi:hypothetical protein
VGRIGSNALEIELGGGRQISEFSTVRMMYTVGLKGIFWKVELHRGSQKLIVPVSVTFFLSFLVVSCLLSSDKNRTDCVLICGVEYIKKA